MTEDAVPVSMEAHASLRRTYLNGMEDAKNKHS